MINPRLIESFRSKPTGSNLGAIRELQVAADLMARGYEVFRACGPNGKADLVARLNEDYTIFIEVRGIVRKADGSLQVQRTPKDRCDLYAGVFDGQVIYFDTLTGNIGGSSVSPPLTPVLPENNKAS